VDAKVHVEKSSTVTTQPSITARDDLESLCIDTIRRLSIDMVQQANSGHPGMPLGAATMAYVLWTRHLRHNPRNPDWPDRDRFVLSAGHASALLYSLLFLTGYDLTMEDLGQFRQSKSRTPGHPEHGRTPGVEVTTGPLGQGFANAVGFAIAERWLAATFNRQRNEIVDHRTYVLASDGDLMEGVAAEAASLAGTLRLGRVIVLYDANSVTLSATTDLTFSEDVGARFEAFGWHVQRIDGQDPIAVDAALSVARATEDRPSLIVARTHIGYGSPHTQDTWHAHGEPLGVEEVRLTKRALGWPEDLRFYVSPDALAEFRRALPAGSKLEAAWRRRMDAYRIAHPDLADSFARGLTGQLPDGWETHLPLFTAVDNAMATRGASRTIINALAGVVTNMVGGSADLDPSTRTAMKGQGDFESPVTDQGGGGVPTQGLAGGVWGFRGRNIHFGLREHAMTAMMTGMALHGGLLPYGATFLSFSDYMRPSIRLAALSKAHVVYVWTHDSIALGEDGPTHQPVEQLASLRAMPNMMILRPSDATETVEAWRIALQHENGPVGLVLTRQKVPVLDRTVLSPASGLARGAYVLIDPPNGLFPELILIASGSEVSLALEAHARLTREAIRCRVVSMPCWELFDAQPRSYRDTVLPPAVRARISIEAAAPFGWERYVGLEGTTIGVSRFGASAPGPVVMREFGFTPEHVVETAKALLQRRPNLEP
jgi:transketolase